tara:strand:- start:727 stop:951 length:225 start_codon:yes stop_codon:yes gene_type:complete
MNDGHLYIQQSPLYIDGVGALRVEPSLQDGCHAVYLNAGSQELVLIVRIEDAYLGEEDEPPPPPQPNLTLVVDR